MDLHLIEIFITKKQKILKMKFSNCEGGGGSSSIQWESINLSMELPHGGLLRKTQAKQGLI